MERWNDLAIWKKLSNEMVDYRNSSEDNVVVYVAKIFDPREISKETNCIKILI